jgi:hypothetical protein
MLGHPQRIETQRFRGVHLLEPLGINLAATAIQIGTIGIKNVITEFHIDLAL